MGDYDVWIAAKSGRTPDFQNDTNICGFWRSVGAKTKNDEPIAIWVRDGKQVLARGDRDIIIEGEKAWGNFIAWSWPHCIPVDKPVYDAATASGFWADGKPTKLLTTEEKAGIITPGDNSAPLEETLADMIASLADAINKVPEPTTQDQANELAGKLDRMKVLLDKAEKVRVAEKEPHLQGGREVDAKWKAIGEPGGDAYRAGTERKKAYLLKEQQRLNQIATEENRKRIEAAKAEAERIAEENRQRVVVAEQKGEPAPEPIHSAPVAPVVVEPERARAGAAFGRSTGLRKVQVAVVADASKLTQHFIDNKDAGFAEYLQTRAAQALRGKVTLPGVESKDEWK